MKTIKGFYGLHRSGVTISHNHEYDKFDFIVQNKKDSEYITNIILSNSISNEGYTSSNMCPHDLMTTQYFIPGNKIDAYEEIVQHQKPHIVKIRGNSAIFVRIINDEENNSIWIRESILVNVIRDIQVTGVLSEGTYRLVKDVVTWVA